jgi:hypothetical protein
LGHGLAAQHAALQQQRLAALEAAQRAEEAQRRLEKLQQSEVLYQWKFHRQTWTFQHTQLPGFHFFPSQQQDPTKMMILNGFGML